MHLLHYNFMRVVIKRMALLIFVERVKLYILAFSNDLDLRKVKINRLQIIRKNFNTSDLIQI